MTVSVACPSCGKSYHVGDESLGARAKCKNCGATFTLSMSMDDTGKSKSGEAPAGGVPPQDAAVRSAHGKSSAGKGPGQSGEPEPMPKKLGQYVVQRKLGAGAMGVVYLARDPILDRQVAVKVLPAELSRDEERLKRFLREAKSAARLHHTNVAAVHQAGAEGRLAYIAMEYVEGTSLDKAVSETKPLEWREATRVIRDAAAGLGAAHAIGLVHRDIKPANLIRTKDGVTKVVDFGLARGQQTNSQLTQRGQILGTPAYMAPEQWTGGPVAASADLYALTCTYYFLLTGRLAFDAPSLAAVGYQHRYEPFPDPRQHVPNLPDGVCRILSRGSAKEPADRFQSAEGLLAELDVLLACPNESLSFGSSWSELAGPAGGDSSPPQAVRSGGIGPPSTPALPPAKLAPSPVSRSKGEVPLWVWIATCGAAALLILLGVMIAFSTKYGMVRIELQGAAAKEVDITLDGEMITFGGLDKPLKVEVGEHNLTARLGDLETVTRSFQVKKNETTMVAITFEPTPPLTSNAAVYRVTIDPSEATLTASGQGVTVAGQGANRTVTVAEPDGKTKAVLLATLDGYRTLRQQLQPVANESLDLVLKLERLPEPPKTMDPARLAANPTVVGTPTRPPASQPSPPWVPPAGAPPLAIAPFDAAKAKEHQAAWAKYLGVPVEMTNSIGIRFVLIPPGEFDMGSTEEEVAKLLEQAKAKKEPGFYIDALQSETPEHRVRIRKPFYLAASEVTQAQYERVMGSNPSTFKEDTTCPVEMVNWDEASAFCRKLGELPEERSGQRAYRLPTEAEWEYACRAGTTMRWCSGDDEASLKDVAWYNANAGGKTHPVCQKMPNAWGLYDMHGNVWEWCQDWWGWYYANSPLDDPTGPAGGSFRVYRGGCWFDGASEGRASFRHWGDPGFRYRQHGLRLARAVSLPASGAASPQKKVASSPPSPAPPTSKPTTRRPASQPSRPSVLPAGEPPPAIAPFDAAKAKECQDAWAKHLNVKVETANSIGLKLVLIPPGEFDMGSTEEEVAKLVQEARAANQQDWYIDRLPAEAPRHRVRITKPFYLGIFEVTQEQYGRVVGSNPSEFQSDRTLPVEVVRWDEAVEFCRKLGELPHGESAPGEYRLPTEAEWEYACRAGTTTKWCSGDDEVRLCDVAWYGANANRKTHPVGQKAPNAWGLYDMHGNVWEWCSDWFASECYQQSAGTLAMNPTGPTVGSDRVYRGGSWWDGAEYCRSVYRNWNLPSYRSGPLGFRVAMSVAGSLASGFPPIDDKGPSK